MAYFRKRGDKWSFTIDLPRDPITDKRNQRTQGGFNTKKDEQLAAATVLKEITDGTFINEKNITFNEFADEWLAIYSHRSKISSVRIRKHEIDKLKGYFKHHKMKSITKFMYQNALNDLKALGYSPNTISGIHVTASLLFTSALEQETIKSSPTVYAKLPKKILTIEEIENEDKKINFLERSELIEFLKTAKSNGLERDFEVFLVLSYTGIRVGELCALKWSDISFEDMTISISKTYYNPNNTTKYSLLTPKTSSSIRTIQVEDLVVSTLKNYKQIQDGLKKTNPNYYDQGFVFAKTGRLQATLSKSKQYNLEWRGYLN